MVELSFKELDDSRCRIITCAADVFTCAADVFTDDADAGSFGR